VGSLAVYGEEDVTRECLRYDLPWVDAIWYLAACVNRSNLVVRQSKTATDFDVRRER